MHAVNKGIVSATKAAELTGGSVIFPAFTDAEKAQGLTDFNDRRQPGTGRFSACHQRPVRTYRGFHPNSNTPEIREALVIGNLVFTPVHTEENHDLTEYPETSPDTGHSHDEDLLCRPLRSRNNQLLPAVTLLMKHCHLPVTPLKITAKMSGTLITFRRKRKAL